MINSLPLVSIIIATYNRSNVLKYTLSTALNQDYQHFEIIVVGDHCTDDTEQVVNSFNDKRIRFINLDRNFGEQSYPNNTGFQQSKGDLIAWLNHDDLWFPDHLSTLIKVIHESGAALAYSWLFPYHAKKFGMNYNLPVYGEKNEYRPFYFVATSAWLVKRTAVLEVGLWKNAWEIYGIPSQEWINRVYKKGNQIIPVNKLTVIAIQSGYRKNSYADRQEDEHKYVFAKLREPGFREELLSTLCFQMALRFNRISFKDYFQLLLKKPIQALFMRTKFNYAGMINRLKYRKKGGFINHLRKLRGLPEKNNENKK